MSGYHTSMSQNVGGRQYCLLGNSLCLVCWLDVAIRHRTIQIPNFGLACQLSFDARHRCNPNAGSGCSNGFLRIVGTYPDLRKGKTYYNMGISSFEMVPWCTNLPCAVQSIGFCHIRLAGCLIFTYRLGFGCNSIYCNTSCCVGS